MRTEMIIMTDKSDHPMYRKVMFNEYPEWADVPYITIPESRIDQCREIARQQASVYYADNADKRQNFEQRVATRTTGLLGEYSFARYYGFDLDNLFESYNPDLNGDGGVDFTAYFRPADQKVNIDVKTTNRFYGNLLCPDDREIVADFYFLLERRNDEVGIVGFSTGKKMKRAEVRDLNYPSKFIERSELNEPPDPIDIRPETITPEY